MSNNHVFSMLFDFQFSSFTNFSQLFLTFDFLVDFFVPQMSLSATGGLIILGSPLVEIMYYCAWIYSDQIGSMAQGVLGNNSEDPLSQNGSINPYVMKVRSLMARHLA